MIRLVLLDRLNNLGEAWILDPTNPRLSDVNGSPLVDMDNHPCYPQRPAPSPNTTKQVLDAFFMRPSRGMYTTWIRDPEFKSYDSFRIPFDTAMYYMLGRIPVSVEWVQ